MAIVSSVSASQSSGQEPASLSLRWEESFVVGQEGSDHEFSSISAIAVGPAGDIVVLDRANHEITVWDRRGRKIHHWGSRGDGPGEFRSPGSLALSPKSTIAITDRSRVSLHSLDGEVLDSRQLAASQLAVRPAFDSGGLLSALTLDLTPAVTGTGALKLVRLDDSRVIWRTDASALLTTKLFRPRPVMAQLSESRVVIGFDLEYRLHVVDLDSGDVVGEIARDVPLRRIDRSFTTRLRGHMKNPVEAPDGWSAIVSAAIMATTTMVANPDEIEFLETFPAIGDVFIGPPGNAIWVRRGLGVADDLASAIDAPGEAEVMWDLFDGRNYAYLGTVVAPDGFVAQAGDSQRLMGVRRNEAGTPLLEVWHVSQPEQAR